MHHNVPFPVKKSFNFFFKRRTTKPGPTGNRRSICPPVAVIRPNEPRGVYGVPVSAVAEGRAISQSWR